MSLQDKIDLFAGKSSFGGSATSDTEFSVLGTPKNYAEQKSSSPAHPFASAFDPFQPSVSTLFPSNTEFSVRDTPRKSLQGKPPAPENSSDTDPFAAIALRSFDGSHSSGAFSSSTGSAVTEITHDSPGTKKNYDSSPLEVLNIGAFTSHKDSHAASATESMSKSLTELKQASMSASKPAAKKETFQVKSGIWADSLSRGLIDLNITARKYLRFAMVINLSF
jgi:epsin